MARAEVEIAFLQEIDVASGMRTNGIKRLNLVTCATEINCANWNLGELVPGVDAVRENWKFARHAVIRESFKPGNAHGRTGAGFATERVQKDFQSGNDRHKAKHPANDGGQKAFEKIAPTDWRRRVTRIVHN